MNLNSNELRFALEGEMSEVNLDTCVKHASIRTHTSTVKNWKIFLKRNV